MNNLSIITSSAEFVTASVKEAQRADPKARLVTHLGSGVALLSTGLDFENFSGILSQQQPVYIRHICPVQLEIPVLNSPEDISQLAESIAALPEVDDFLQPGTTVAVQVRFVDENPDRAYSAAALREGIIASLTGKTKAVETVKEPEVVTSVVVSNGVAYAGLSFREDNLSGWAGGMRRYARLPEMISRAEFKLLEALEVFGLEMPDEGLALDLGAAPGGWSRLLLEAGLQVVAVDPAELDQRLLNKPGLSHYKGYAAEYLILAANQDRSFDIIAGDLRMDALLAADLLVRASSLLTPQGWVISTLKLPHASYKLDPVKITQQALAILRKAYKEVRAHQLFNNRQEVTVFLRR